MEDSSDWLELDQRGSYSLLVGLDLTSRRAVDFLVVLQTGRRLVSPEVAARRPVCLPDDTFTQHARPMSFFWRVTNVSNKQRLLQHTMTWRWRQ